MAKHRGRKQTRRHRRRQQSRHQKGGSGMGDGYYDTVTSDPQMSAAGTPLEVYKPISFCGWDNGRVAPAINPTMMSQFGGRRSRRRQQGGGCGCMAQVPMQAGGGSGNGGYMVDVTNNSMQKMYAAITPGPCLPVPRENQIGGGPAPVPAGSAADQLGIVSYKTGFGYNPSSVVSTDSAHYLDQVSYDRTCGQTGGKRHRKSKKSKKGRKGR